MTIRTQKELLACFDGSPARVRWYFSHLRQLIEEFPYEVALAFAFSQVELAHNMILYCGMVKLHSVDSELAHKAVDQHHLTRSEFCEKTKVIYGKAIPRATSGKLESAESVRDKVMHGKRCAEAEKRTALSQVLEYAAEVNDFLEGEARLQPFGDLRGFKGRGTSHDRKTSRWIVRGMGFGM